MNTVLAQYRSVATLPDYNSLTEICESLISQRTYVELLEIDDTQYYVVVSHLADALSGFPDLTKAKVESRRTFKLESLSDAKNMLCALINATL